MTKIFKKERAQEMRREGISIGSIAMELHVSKSTVSKWCQDISLTQRQIEALTSKRREAGVRAFLFIAEERRKERKKNIEYYTRVGKRDVGGLTKRDLFILGIGLYWGEGYKNGSEETAFTNSDPYMMSIFISWLKRIYGIDKSKLIFRISINQIHKKRIDVILKYWTHFLGVSKSQFTKPSFIKAPVKKIYKNSDEYYGILRVKARNGVNLQRRILGSIEKLRNIEK